jgi:hypothetical protein
VRLSSRKIEYLSNKVLKLIQDNRLLHLTGHPDLVQRAVADAIWADLRAEEEIEEEVENLLAAHRAQIQGQEMDLTVLRQKMKRELARKRGFTL